LDLDLGALADRARRFYSAEPRPFVKWAGSKRFLLPEIVPLLPKKINTYHEPFLGSGALFFLIRPEVAFLSDACHDLIATYSAVADDPEAVLSTLNQWPASPELYYQLRNEVPSADRYLEAAKFIYLNRNCWNGLFRVNLSGKFNVPYGRPKTSNELDASNFRACAQDLGRSTVAISSGDFGHNLQAVAPGDLVFLDPPYVTKHNNNGFREYNERLFSWADQLRLAQIANTLADRGANIIVTNAFHPDIADLYAGFTIVKSERSSTIASNKSKRGSTMEAIIYYCRSA
jgi:DNA adenine methylase